MPEVSQNTPDLKYLNALNKIEGVGAQRLKKLLARFGSGEAAFAAGRGALEESGVGPKLAERIFLEKKSINPEEEWEKMKRENIHILTPNDPAYPQLLNEIPNPPYLLYIRGTFEFNRRPAIAIVGARKYTPYGAQAARTLAKDLTAAGVTVVSGMALGIDSFAHRGALDAGGETLAILGDSLDDENIYPRNNFNLSREIMESGALISEYPVATPAGPLTFPARNRIVAGLTQGTLVVEAGEKSGALITAGLALEYNREVFSVPGPIFSAQSLGTNSLIRSGARLVTGVADVLEELNLNQSRVEQKTASKNPSSSEEKRLLELLSGEPIHIDKLAKLAKLQTAAVSSTLSIMEIKGWVKNIGGQNYISL